MRVYLLLFVMWASPLALASDVKSGSAGRVISVSGTVLTRSDEKAASSTPLKLGAEVKAQDVINTSSTGTAKLLLDDKSIIDIGPSTLFHVKKFEKNGGNDRNVDLTVMYGSLRAAVTKPIEGKGKFRVRTPTATMGVRGTEFLIKSEIGSLAEIKEGIRNPGKPLAADHNDNRSRKGDDPKENDKPTGKTEIVVVQGRVDVEAPKVKPVSGMTTGIGKASIGSGMGVVSLTAGQKLVSDTSSSAPLAPVTLNVEQMKAAVSTIKIEDNTFKKSIVVDVSNNNSGGSGKGANQNQTGNGTSGRTPASKSDSGSAAISGAATQAIVAAAVTASIAPTLAAPANAPLTAPVASSNSIGTFGSDSALTPAPVNVIAGGLKRVQVRISR